ncbi:YfjI family protein [Pseudomonas aeruginosa]|uniref:YfjI family protein n=1 Tax=Pseudomonas aeruginosa TaxID=287 RepID=UPI001EDD4238|nr:YfjI family protein [Pseudomonas aeruginosa]MCS9014596.1 YfjI family protein [Pseudomonas aeruginosa]
MTDLYDQRQHLGRKLSERHTTRHSAEHTPNGKFRQQEQDISECARSTPANREGLLAEPIEQDYPEPIPLLAEMEVPSSYPLDALGDILGGAAKAIAESVQVPDAMAGQSILTAAAMATQPHSNVLRAGQLIPLSLFGLTVAESGDRKSTADRLALRSHYERQSNLLMAHKTGAKAYRDRQDAYQKARSAILDKIKSNPTAMSMELSNLQEPDAPRLPFMLAEEPTLEGLQKSLLQGQASQGLFSDEGGQFFGGYANKPENMLKSAAGLSKLWDGSAIFRTRAADGENASRSGCRLSMHLMIQPIVAQAVLNNPILQGQGFLARFLVAWPPSLAGTRFYREIDPTQDSRLLRYWQRMTDLLEQEPLTNAHGELSPATLHLTPEALCAWSIEHDAIEAQLGRNGDFLEIKATAAKAGENLLRIAGVLAVVEDASPIGVTLIERATQLIRWYLDEALRLIAPIKSDPQLSKAQQLLEWLCDKKWTQFDARTLQHDGPRAVRESARKRDELLAILVEHKYLSTHDGKQFRLSPKATMATMATTPRS